MVSEAWLRGLSEIPCDWYDTGSEYRAVASLPPTTSRYAVIPYELYWIPPVDSFLTVLVRMHYIVLETDESSPPLV